VLVLAALPAGACTSAQQGWVSGSAVKQGGILRIGSDVGVDSLNPFVGIESVHQG